MSFRQTCHTGVHVLQDGISFRMICLTGRLVLLEVCLIGGHVLQEYMCYERTYITE